MLVTAIEQQTRTQPMMQDTGRIVRERRRERGDRSRKERRERRKRENEWRLSEYLWSHNWNLPLRDCLDNYLRLSLRHTASVSKVFIRELDSLKIVSKCKVQMTLYSVKESWQMLGYHNSAFSCLLIQKVLYAVTEMGWLVPWGPSGFRLTCKLNYHRFTPLWQRCYTHRNPVCFYMLLTRESTGLMGMGECPPSVRCHHLRVFVTWPCACSVNSGSKLTTSCHLCRLLISSGALSADWVSRNMVDPFV